MKAGHNQTQMAAILGVHKSTIGRELSRNCGRRGYRPKQAHELACSRQLSAHRRYFTKRISYISNIRSEAKF
jgi:IS30 family transposase